MELLSQMRSLKNMVQAGMPDNTLKLNFTGAAGQSFGAFATKGLTMTVYGKYQ